MRHADDVRGAEFSPDGRRVLTASNDKTARVWDAATGRPVGSPMKYADAVFEAHFSPDGRAILTASLDRTARIWDAATGRSRTPPFVIDWAVAAAAWSPDSRFVAAGTQNGGTQIWDATTGQPITWPQTYGIRGWWSTSVSFSPDSRRLLTSGTSFAIIWSLPEDDRPFSDLQSLAHLLASGRIDATSGFVPLGAEELRRDWSVLRARYPVDFMATPTDLLAWHRRAAESLERAGLWGRAFPHLSALIQSAPSHREYRLRRVRSLMALGRKKEALADYARALSLPRLPAPVDQGREELARSLQSLDFPALALTTGPDPDPMVAPPLKTTQPAPRRSGLTGEYFASPIPSNGQVPQDPPDPSRLRLTRTDRSLDFDWGSGPPAPAVPMVHFQTRWTGLLKAPESAVYDLQVESDDGARLWVDGERLIDAWVNRGPTKSECLVYLEAGWHRLQIDYFQNTGGASIHLRWNYPFDKGMRLVPAEALGH